MCERGYAASMVLSHDTNCGGDLSAPGGTGDRYFTHIAEEVIPALLERGVSQGDVDLMITENPKTIFAAAAARSAELAAQA